jgi:hypothetical protein
MRRNRFNTDLIMRAAASSYIILQTTISPDIMRFLRRCRLTSDDAINSAHPDAIKQT